MHQKLRQTDLSSYWIVHTYDPSIDMFIEAFKSYGLNVANDKLTEYLRSGVCAVLKQKSLPTK